MEDGLRRYFAFYNHERSHQSLDCAVPVQVHQGLVGLVCWDGTLNHFVAFVVKRLGLTLVDDRDLHSEGPAKVQALHPVRE